MTMWWALGGVVFADAMGNMALGGGMKEIGDVTTAWQSGQVTALLRSLARNRRLGLGIACYAAAFLLFLAVLHQADLSFAFPVTALGSVANTLGARVILKEHVSAKRWLGTWCVCLGVFLLSLGPTGR